MSGANEIKPTDLIINDIKLPDADGYDILKMLGSNDKYVNLPIIALTANAFASDVKKGLAAGFNHDLTEAVNLSELDKLVRR